MVHFLFVHVAILIGHVHKDVGELLDVTKFWIILLHLYLFPYQYDFLVIK